MSTAALELSPVTREPSSAARAAPWTIVLAALFVATMCYVADQDWRFSQLDLGEEVMESSTVEGNPTRRFGLLVLGAAGVVLLIRRGGDELRVRGALAWLCLGFVLWSAASLAWAENQEIVFRRLLADACLVAMALALARWASPRQLAWIALLATGCFLVVGIAAELSLGLFHPFDPEYRFSGTMHPNDQGMQRAVMCLAALYLARGGWGAAGGGRGFRVQSSAFNVERSEVAMSRGSTGEYAEPRTLNPEPSDRLTPSSPRRITLSSLALLAAAAVSFGFLLLTKSRTSLAAALVSMAALQLTIASRRARVGWVLGTIFLLSWGLLLTAGRMADSLAEAFLLGREHEETATFTGRVPLWQDLWKYAQQRPLCGYGYNGYWTPQHIAEVSNSQGWPVAVGHSAYLDLLLGLGVAGLVLGLPIAVLTIAQSARHEHRWPGCGYGFILAVTVLCLCDGLSESNVLLPRFVPLVVVTGIAMLAFQRGMGDGELGIGAQSEVPPSHPRFLIPGPSARSPALRPPFPLPAQE